MAQATQDATSIEDLEGQVEEAAQHLDALLKQHLSASSQIKRSEKRLTELEERRRLLAPRTFAGDAQARVELEGVEDECDEVARNVRVAEAALPELERMVAEAKERLAQARQDVHRARAQVVHDELKDVEARRDELAEELKEVLKAHSSLHADYMEAVRLYSQDAANNLAMYRLDMYGRWLRKAFSKWM